jgi:hypothetical protein
MSSINFTGLKSIKIGSGSTEATVYFRGTKLWPSVISPTFAVVDDISAYTDTTYVDVYDKKTSSWYKLNDLKVYEKYGIYEKVTTLDRAVFVEKGCDVDLNNQWRKSTYWSQTDYTCYESNSNYNVNNSYSSMKVIIPEGMSSVTVYFGSYAESTYDYSVLWQLDKNKPTSNPDDTTSGVVASSKGKQGSKIAYTYKISDTSKSHFFWITYRKDTSNNSNNDRGYLLIKQDIITGTTVYPDKLVIYNNDEYRWNGNQWLRLGSYSGGWNLLTTSYDKTIPFTKIAFCKPWRYISYDMYLSDEPNDSYTGYDSKAFKNRIYLGQEDRPHIVQQALGSGETAYENPAASLYGTTTINGNSFYVWDKYTVPRYFAGAKSGAVFDNNMMYVYVKPVYPFEYPEKDTPPALITFNSVAERDAYTGVYNGLICQVGDDYYVYNNGWKINPVLKVDNIVYTNGKWVMSDTNSGSKIKTLTVTVESPVECIVYAECNYSSSGTAFIIVDGTDAAYWQVESQTSGSCTLTPGTHTVTFKGAEHIGAGYTEYWSYLNPSKCYIQLKA